jgi:ethanolamine ammonia-lyase small subunit
MPNVPEDPPGHSLDMGLPDFLEEVRLRTPARLLLGRSGAAYRTQTQIELREAHAATRDAVRAELNLTSAFGAAFVDQWGLFEAHTRATSKDEYLLRPDLGRHFADDSRAAIQRRCATGCELQIAIGDGLSVPAISAQVPGLLPLLYQGAEARDWKVGTAFAIQYCRVGILNEIGELVTPQVAILLIGERPGLATAESLSAYMAYRPRAGHTDADRNLISNIHARGVSAEGAASRILNLAADMMTAQTSGSQLRGLTAGVIASSTGKSSV